MVGDVFPCKVVGESVGRVIEGAEGFVCGGASEDVAVEQADDVIQQQGWVWAR